MFTVLVDGLHISQAFFSSNEAIEKAVDIISRKEIPIKECVTVRSFELVGGESSFVNVVYKDFFFVAKFDDKDFNVKE
jgi:hypothetical protein